MAVTMPMNAFQFLSFVLGLSELEELRDGVANAEKTPREDVTTMPGKTCELYALYEELGYARMDFCSIDM